MSKLEGNGIRELTVRITDVVLSSSVDICKQLLQSLFENFGGSSYAESARRRITEQAEKIVGIARMVSDILEFTLSVVDGVVDLTCGFGNRAIYVLICDDIVSCIWNKTNPKTCQSWHVWTATSSRVDWNLPNIAKKFSISRHHPPPKLC